MVNESSIGYVKTWLAYFAECPHCGAEIPVYGYYDLKIVKFNAPYFCFQCDAGFQLLNERK